MTALLTISDAAKAIQMSESWIRAAIRNKELPVVRFGRSKRIRPEDLDAYVKGKIEGTAKRIEAFQQEFTERPIQAIQHVTFRNAR